MPFQVASDRASFTHRLDPGVFTYCHYLEIEWTNQNLYCTIITSSLWSVGNNGKSLFLSHLEIASPFRATIPNCSMVWILRKADIWIARKLTSREKLWDKWLHIWQEHWEIVVIYISTVKLRLQALKTHLLSLPSLRNRTRFKMGDQAYLRTPFKDQYSYNWDL